MVFGTNRLIVNLCRRRCQLFLMAGFGRSKSQRGRLWLRPASAKDHRAGRPVPRQAGCLPLPGLCADSRQPHHNISVPGCPTPGRGTRPTRRRSKIRWLKKPTFSRVESAPETGNATRFSNRQFRAKCLQSIGFLRYRGSRRDGIAGFQGASSQSAGALPLT